MDKKEATLARVASFRINIVEEATGRVSSRQCSRWTISLPVVPCVVCPAHGSIICGADIANVDGCYEHVFHLYHDFCGLGGYILFLCHITCVLIVRHKT